jgi:ribosomal protein S12 methylthiotransferase
VSQDTSAYGVDVRYRTGFVGGRPVKTRMLELAAGLDARARAHDAWVRLHYVYPYPHVDDVVSLMAEGPRPRGLLPYLDIPFQHASPRVLKLMKRPAAPERVLDRLAAWRRERPGIVVRSTFIVGFPGETEAEFEELLAFLEAADLDRVGCFAYSAVDGAAANALPDAVPEAVKEERRARFMAVQAAISARKLQRRVGSTLDVLIDSIEAPRGRKPGVAIGRSAADAPDIDGVVRIAGARDLQPGAFVPATITGAAEHDLTAQPA